MRYIAAFLKIAHKTQLLQLCLTNLIKSFNPTNPKVCSKLIEWKVKDY